MTERTGAVNRQLTFGEYRRLDLGLFAAMLGFSEYIITMAATRWFPGQPFTVSITAAMTAIVMMRWGIWAALHAALGGAVFCFVSGASGQQYIIYCIGNLLGLGALGYIRLLGSEKIRKDVVLSCLLGVLTLVLMQTGRALAALALGQELGRCVGFYTTDALSGLFAMVIIYIVRNLDGIFENQKSYLIRLQKQNNNVKGGF